MLRTLHLDTLGAVFIPAPRTRRAPSKQAQSTCRGSIRNGWHLATALAALVAVAPLASAASDPEFEPEIIDMSPDAPASWSMRNVFAPFSAIFLGGPKYWYAERELVVDTTPSGATVDLFYLRSGFQKRFEQAETPVRVILPPRIEALARDALRIRAIAPGHRQEGVTFKVQSRQREVVIDLEPLPNRLQSVAHRYFAGRASLTFLTDELLQPRLQEEGESFTVILTETAMSPEADATLGSIRDGIIAESFGRQLGEDLAVNVVLRPVSAGSTEVRSRQAYDAARELHVFAIDLLPAGSAAGSVNDALAALGRLRPAHVGACAMRFDETLRSSLDRGGLSRALTPRGEFTDRYVRSAMRRFGEIADGRAVRFLDGSRFDPSVPIELDAALSQAESAIGFLALLRSFAIELDGPELGAHSLRSLVAPELDAAGFETLLEGAERAERACLASR